MEAGYDFLLSRRRGPLRLCRRDPGRLPTTNVTVAPDPVESASIRQEPVANSDAVRDPLQTRRNPSPAMGQWIFCTMRRTSHLRSSALCQVWCFQRLQSLTFRRRQPTTYRSAFTPGGAIAGGGRWRLAIAIRRGRNENGPAKPATTRAARPTPPGRKTESRCG